MEQHRLAAASAAAVMAVAAAPIWCSDALLMFGAIGSRSGDAGRTCTGAAPPGLAASFGCR